MYKGKSKGETMLKPIHQMTEKEFDSLLTEVQCLYPPVLGGCRPSHSNYYFCAIIDHFRDGGTVSIEVWECLHPSERDYLQNRGYGLP